MIFLRIISGCVEGETRAARGNCSLYAQCVHGQIILRPCPPGTVYDRIAKVCNFPSQVPHQRCFRGIREKKTLLSSCD